MGRHLDERLALRAPWLFRRLNKLLMALPVDSSVRRRALRWIGERGWAAFSRGDDEVLLLFVDRDVELNHIGSIPGVGLGASYRGIEGFLELHTPEALIDLGDRLVWRVRLLLAAQPAVRASIRPVVSSSGLADGAIVRSDAYWQWSECIKALGLDDIARTVSP